jgi:hypothetical protein
MSASCKYLVLGSAAALFALPAFAAEETPNAPMVAGTTATAVVKCPGVTSIPFTADAEQALPMKIVGALTCGDTVAVLSDLEGYTAQIRTKDGREGYVARMYLAEGHGTAAAVQKPQATSATPVNGVVRWAAGAPGCDEFISHGRHVESITANGVTVQVSIQDSGWKYRANVAVSNQSGEKLLVLPGIITLDELRPNLHSLYATDPAKLAHNTTHQIFWTLTDFVPTPSAVAHNHSSVSEFDLAKRTSPAPDYLNPHMALASAHHGGFEREQSIDVQSIALKTSSVPAGQMTAGVMWFNRDNAAHDLSMRVPVGNMVFDFAFSQEQKKQ